jgi:hypothetical protein
VIAPATPAQLAEMSARLQYPVGADTRGIVESHEGTIRAIVAYDDWTQSCVTMHIWIGDPAAMSGGDFFRAAFTYPFVQAGKQIVQGVTPADNATSLRFQKWLGFKEVARIPDGWAIGTDTIITHMRHAECPWLMPNKAREQGN